MLFRSIYAITGDDVDGLQLLGPSAQRGQDPALGGGWRLLSVLRIIPTPLLDVVYRLVARVRYRVFGQLEACPIPSAADRARFLDATVK